MLYTHTSILRAITSSYGPTPPPQFGPLRPSSTPERACSTVVIVDPGYENRIVSSRLEKSTASKIAQGRYISAYYCETFPFPSPWPVPFHACPSGIADATLEFIRRNREHGPRSRTRPACVLSVSGDGLRGSLAPLRREMSRQ